MALGQQDKAEPFCEAPTRLSTSIPLPVSPPPITHSTLNLRDTQETSLLGELQHGMTVRFPLSISLSWLSFCEPSQSQDWKITCASPSYTLDGCLFRNCRAASCCFGLLSAA